MNYERIGKEQIEKATIKLVSSKSIDKVSVQQIVDEAGVSRQTFYKYFYDKYDVVLYHYVSDMESTIAACRNKNPWNTIIGKLLEQRRNEKQFYLHAFRSCRYNPLHDLVTKYLANSYIDEVMLRMKNDKIDDKLKFGIKYNAYAASECMFEWFDSDMKEDPYQLADYVVGCMPDVMKQYFITG
jgi:AcrR family transcriptional regulator